MERQALPAKTKAFLRRYLLALLLTPILAWAAVTALDVANAVRNSPDASPWLKAHADAVGNLALRVENTRGDLSAYNGSCCYGILQMNKRNIATTPYTPEQFRRLPLQEQINAWSKIMSPAMQSAPVRQLQRMGTFDGRPVDSHMLLACAQLGIGNCQTMINSGRCSGFADINGTTICGMAAKMQGINPGPNLANQTTPVRPVNPGGTGIPAVANNSMTGLTMEQAFEQGSGVSMKALKSIIHGIATAVVLLIMGSCLIGLWRQYAAGEIEQATFIEYTKKIFMVVIAIALVMTIF